jgi:hypothetical protein
LAQSLIIKVIASRCWSSQQLIELTILAKLASSSQQKLYMDCFSMRGANQCSGQEWRELECWTMAAILSWACTVEEKLHFSAGWSNSTSGCPDWCCDSKNHT